MTKTIDAEMAGYAASVAKALTPVAAAGFDWGSVYVSGVSFGFEGEDAGFSLVPDETGEGYEIVLKEDA